jgi:hypothetical protein
MISKDAIIEQLSQVVQAVRQMRANGIACVMPGVVMFEDDNVYFEIHLQDETELAVEAMRREAARATYSYPVKGN